LGQPVVNFTNISQAAFLYKSVLLSFYFIKLVFANILAEKITKLRCEFEIFGAKILYKKRARKTLMKLTPEDGN
jgi:hypothetical protein